MAMSIEERRTSQHTNCMRFALAFSELFEIKIDNNFLAKHGKVIRNRMIHMKKVHEENKNLDDTDLALEMESCQISDDDEEEKEEADKEFVWPNIDNVEDFDKWLHDINK